MNTNNKTNNKLICQAVKKDGNPCKWKAKCDSKYCGVHKDYVDTSKPLFTEEEEEIYDMPEDDSEYHIEEEEEPKD